MANDAAHRTLPYSGAVILSVLTENSGRCTFRSRDGLLGGTFVNRNAALKEIKSSIAISGRRAIIVVEPGPTDAATNE